ncbi:MAG: FAD-dependent oxidoreductase [Planctomycetia bacterium]|nr:FAD-dependent oxidoreductase [Planctomycetia bacterium]
MDHSLNRRDLLKVFGTMGISSAVGYLALNQQARADFGLSEVNDAKRGDMLTGSEAVPFRLVNGEVIRPELKIPQIKETDVLVVGGGAAGCVAAIAAARAGVKTTIVERYNHFGGLATGGLVLAILGHWANNVQVVQGIGEEMMQRLEKMPYGIVGRIKGRNPTVDSEAYKYLLVEMLSEAGVDIYLHSWISDSINEGSVVKGAVIQSKIGPLAIMAKQIIDTTGDGDVFVSAGAAYERRKYIIGLPNRYMDMPKLKKGTKRPRNYGGITPIEGVRWVGMRGKFSDGVDPKALSDLEVEYRKKIWSDYLLLKQQPGFEEVKLIETAPQLGVRVSRVIKGMTELTRDGVNKEIKYEDCVGIGGSWSNNHVPWQLSYGAMLPQNIENLLTAGRSVCADTHTSELVRVIPNCWMSGHAAGCAAAAAVLQNTTARKVDLRQVRELLIKQKAYLG